VVLQAVIGREGNILDARSISPDVHQELTKSAIDAVKQWRYEPTLLNGVSVEVVSTVRVNFALSHRE
jgi:TonB family protein